jgi:hypothetical protein
MTFEYNNKKYNIIIQEDVPKMDYTFDYKYRLGYTLNGSPISGECTKIIYDIYKTDNKLSAKYKVYVDVPNGGCLFNYCEEKTDYIIPYKRWNDDMIIKKIAPSYVLIGNELVPAEIKKDKLYIEDKFVCSLKEIMPRFHGCLSLNVSNFIVATGRFRMFDKTVHRLIFKESDENQAVSDVPCFNCGNNVIPRQLSPCGHRVFCNNCEVNATTDICIQCQ